VIQTSSPLCQVVSLASKPLLVVSNNSTIIRISPDNYTFFLLQHHFHSRWMLLLFYFERVPNGWASVSCKCTQTQFLMQAVPATIACKQAKMNVLAAVVVVVAGSSVVQEPLSSGHCARMTTIIGYGGCP
jgi:hypothetical protein